MNHHAELEEHNDRMRRVQDLEVALTAAEAEVEALKHDIARHVTIASQEATARIAAEAALQIEKRVSAEFAADVTAACADRDAAEAREARLREALENIAKLADASDADKLAAEVALDDIADEVEVALATGEQG